MSSVALVAAVIAVIIFQFAAVLLAFRVGVHIADAIVVLAVLAYLAFLYLLRVRGVRLMPPWVGAFLLAVLSSWLSMLLPLNIYGS